MEGSSEPGFWEFNKKRVTVKTCVPHRNLGGAELRGRVQDQKGSRIIQRGHQPVCDVKVTGLDTQLCHGRSQ